MPTKTKKPPVWKSTLPGKLGFHTKPQPQMVDELTVDMVELTVDMLFPKVSEFMGRPGDWVRAVLGEHLWSKQNEIIESVWKNKKTAVPSCHGSGKSFLASRTALAWIATHPRGTARVITSAPTAAQVSSILWHEIGIGHRKWDAPETDKGTIGMGAVPTWKITRQEVGSGRKPADKVSPEEAMQAFQGIHAEYLLVILDEACGIPKWLWDAADTLATAPDNRILAIGNPDNPSSEFYNKCKPGSGWEVISISAFDLPWYTGEKVPDFLHKVLTGREWVKDAIRTWGKNSPLTISKVFGKFPKDSTDSLISPAMIERAIAADFTDEAKKMKGWARYGVDIADQGEDQTVIYKNTAGRVRLAEYEGKKCVWNGQSPDVTAGWMLRLWVRDGRQTSFVVDGIGMGLECVRTAHKIGLDTTKSFNAAKQKGVGPKFQNARSEMWWTVRRAFVDGKVDIDELDLDLQAQLLAIKWEMKNGKIAIEEKKETKKRLSSSSPDKADAFMHSFFEHDHYVHPDDRGGERILDTYDERGDLVNVLEHTIVSESAGVMEADL